MWRTRRIWVAASALVLIVIAWYASKNAIPKNDVTRVPEVSSPANAGFTARVRRPDIAVISKYLPQRLTAHKYIQSRYKPEATVATPAELVFETKHDAQNGSAEAMYWMALGLRKCARVDASPNEEIESKVAKRSIGKQAMDLEKGRIVDADDVVNQASTSAQTLEQLRDSCKKIQSEELGA